MNRALLVEAGLARPTRLNNGRWQVLVFAMLLGGWAVAESGIFSGHVINLAGWPLLRAFFDAAARPDLSPDFLRLTLHASAITFCYAVCGLALSLILGFAGGVLSSEVWWTGTMRGSPWLAIRGLLAVPRSIHEVIWALFFVATIGLDSVSAILALGLPFGAITAKVFSEILDESPRGAYHAFLNAGAAKGPAFLYGLLPHALPNLLSYSFYRFECAIRSSAVLGVIGAGGLGYEILLSFQSLRYAQIWTLLFALIALSGFTDLWSSRLRRWLDAPTRVSILASRDAGGVHGLLHGSRPLRWLVAAAAVVTVLSFIYVQPDLSRLTRPQTFLRVAEIARRAVPPDLGASQVWLLLRLGGQTLAMSVLAIGIAGIGGIALSYAAASSWGRSQVDELPAGLVERQFRQVRIMAVRLLLLACRALPPSVWALLILFVVFPGVLPGALAIALHNLGILGRLMGESAENLDPKPLAALRAAGTPTPHIFLYGVLPATLSQNISYVLYRWEVCARETVLVGLVGAGGLGRLVTEQLSSFDYSGVLSSLMAMFVLTLMVDLMSARARSVVR